MNNIIERKQKLEEARGLLKKEFVGIDAQIDDVIELVHAWYCFPEGQLRPTVINLVGMTGVGKTSLIERLFDILGLVNSYYKFDMGYYANNAENLRHELSKKVRSYDGNPICFVLDEFQLCRSISDEGAEIDRGNFRPIWDLLDHGKISLIEQNYGVDMLHLLIVKLEHCVQHGALESNGLTITKGEKLFLEIFGKEAYDEDDGETNEAGEKKELVPSLVPDRYFYYIQECLPDRFISDDELRRYLSSLKSHIEIISFLKEAINAGGRPKTYDFSNSIIFVIANVDEAYIDAKDADPDMDADVLHKHSMDITLFDLKQSLSKRFRIEQIARLGNNYVIYPAFSSKTYRKLIQLELKKKSDLILEKFGIIVNFDKSVNKIIFNEGVFPTHGSRPVFSTINYVIGSFLGRMMSLLVEKDKLTNTERVEWKFKNNKNHLTFYEKGSNKPFHSESYTVNIKVDSLRKPKNNDEQAQVSVHEAGHAIASAALLGHIPSKVISSSAGAADGFNLITLNKIQGEEYAIKMVSVYLAGIEAEKLIFGLANTESSGSCSDIDQATKLVTMMVKESGLYFPWASDPTPESNSHDTLLDTDNVTVEKSYEIMKRARDTVKKLLETNKNALTALSLELFKTPVLYRKRIAQILEENGMKVKEFKEGYYKEKLFSFEKEKSKVNSVKEP